MAGEGSDAVGREVRVGVVMLTESGWTWLLAQGRTRQGNYQFAARHKVYIVMATGWSELPAVR